jgi:hypothetical protein
VGVDYDDDVAGLHVHEHPVAVSVVADVAGATGIQMHGLRG